ncbi:hypothetical protein BgiMline_014355, partial [Biomphalaria glabrata]
MRKVKLCSLIILETQTCTFSQCCRSTGNSRQHQLKNKFVCRKFRIQQDVIPGEFLSMV